MNKTNILFALAMVASFAAASPALAETNFAVVDMQKVMETTDVAKDIFQQLDAKRKEFQTEISKEEETLRAAEKSIMDSKDSISKNEFENKRKAFEDKLMQGQKTVQERKRTLDYALNQSIGKLRGEAVKIVANIAKEKKYSAVFTTETVMISDPNLDITDTVISKMNKDVSKFKVDWSAAPSAPAANAKK